MRNGDPDLKYKNVIMTVSCPSNKADINIEVKPVQPMGGSSKQVRFGVTRSHNPSLRREKVVFSE